MTAQMPGEYHRTERTKDTEIYAEVQQRSSHKIIENQKDDF